MLDSHYKLEEKLKTITKTKPKTKLKYTSIAIDIFQQNWHYIQPLFNATCAATAEIVFLRGTKIGAILLAAMLLQPSVLLMGITGILAAVVFAYVAQLGNSYQRSAPFLFNPMLAGLGVGYLFRPSPASLFLAAASGVLAFLLTWTLSNILQTFLYLPVLSLPFVAVSWVVHLAAFRYAGLHPAIVPSHAYTIGLPLYLEGFLRTLGLIFFLPNVWVGMVVAVLLLLNSRIQFLLAIFGYFLGTEIRGILTGTFAYVYYDPGTLNFILVAMAIGGFYLLPSPRSYILAGFGVTLAALLGEAISVFWAAVGLPVHALPYNLVTLSLLYILGLAGHSLLVRYPQASPEKTLDAELTARLRYQGTGRTISLPFAGSWIVWQGFDGKWTHQGLWRYAYDFLIKDEKGLTYRGNGLQLSDYYAYQKPILSPIRGWVVRVVKDLPDCAISSVDTDNNWGNYVILYDERGFYVEISHFAQNTITVNQGDRIERGTLLGRCGNSGYSPQPHIHIQVQLTPEIGAATVPFSFANLRVNNEFFAEFTPVQDTLLEPVSIDRTLWQAFTFSLDSELHFTVTKKGKITGEILVKVCMAVDGTFYLDSGKAKLFFSRDLNGFMFHRLEGEDADLAVLFLALPKLPLVRQIGQQWSDYLPISLVTNNWRRMLYQLGSSLYPYLASARYMGLWESDAILSGAIAIPGVDKLILTSANFADDGQLLSVSVGPHALIRK